jgi:predicted small integral membrane protein
MATTNKAPARHSAGLFDVRNIIGLLLLIYGVVLLVMGLVATSDAELAKAGGINANLWSGIVMAVIGALFIFWAIVRPTVVPDDPDLDGTQTTGGDSASS